MNKNIKITLISIMSLLLCLFRFAAAAEVHFQGRIVEPACDVLMQKEISCHPIAHQREIHAQMLNTDAFISKDQVEQFVQHQNKGHGSMWSIELMDNSAKPQNIANLMVKYR
ncbi:type 1 fimbrial protein [Acinetobacter ihumii]|uniref:type 1 fimbrial protein n=1 Tax=Acinetobacter ihumii TaxID=2483802 RepID=UPI00102F3DA0|nr:type 1 fimbrial protein [Acinetobacter ihumii]